MKNTCHLFLGSNIGLALQIREPRRISGCVFECNVCKSNGMFTNISSSVFMTYLALSQLDVTHFNIITDFNVRLLYVSKKRSCTISLY